ncbi:alpha/beta hydrolase [Streptomyces roseicoloratus]|uniref:Alpha/beta hydrolase n=1 Tax=Streptomyces roseicoloratus TaxID=2508722 RepID=A0ABY9RQI4_9ACTN|nr:alpha/beta hydrolase [Streptomyces roseicoloratus]WMX44195.1 alpha/beta hydrolase [Streptomyces roseicoloratus]
MSDERRPADGWRPAAGEPGLYTAGPEDGEPLVLVHGIRLSAWMWQPYTARLTPRFRLTACDLPGHGALRGRPFTLEGAVDRVGAAVREAARATGRRPWVAGVSLGGYTTLAYGALGDGGAAGLLVNGATARADGPLARAFTRMSRTIERIGAARAERLNEAAFRRLLPYDTAVAALHGGLAMETFPEVVADLRRRDFLALAHACATPVQFVNGRRDRRFRADEHAFLDAVRADGTPAGLALVPGGHISCLTDPDLYSRILVRGHAELTRLAGRSGPAGKKEPS